MKAVDRDPALPVAGKKIGAIGALSILAGLLFIFAAWVAVRFMGQPLLEAHEFRQTQTALTAYWLLKDGLRLAYETPVAGAPWSIPFEFPLYQWLAAKMAGVSMLPLDSCGRLLSFVFLIACLCPARAIVRRLCLGGDVFGVFACLLLSSPLYLFWGRCFLIETAALFFSLAFVPLALRLQQRPDDSQAACFAGLLISLGLLQKVTTGLPILAVLVGCWLVTHHRRLFREGPGLREMACLLLAYAVPLVICFAWTRFTDHVKQHNPLGAMNTSSETIPWVFGTVHQRISPETWRTLLWERLLAGNAGGVAGMVFLCGTLGFSRDRTVVRVVAAAMVLTILPLLVFTPLHLLHDYYQTACGLFLIGGLAVAICYWVSYLAPSRALLLAVTALFVAGNVYRFHMTRWRTLHATFPASENTTTAIAGILRTRTPLDSGFVAFGYDWSSTLSYYSERKSFTVPWFFKDYKRVWEKPESYLGGKTLGAIVVCPASGAPFLDVEERVRKDPSLTLLNVRGCAVLLREHR